MTTQMDPTIFHIADIHIRYRQHERIKYAFDQLVQKIKDHPSKNKFLVIAGDIFEYKSRVSQQDLSCFHYLLENLQIPNLKIITIPGNHDFAPSSELDFIKVALQNTSYDNVYHYPISGVYTHDNIDFHILSPIDQKVPPMELSENHQIAIIHEPITGCTLYGSKEQLEGRFTALQLSKKYDLTIAGDLHKRQQVMKIKNVAYSGSLVQKNKGEKLVHGGIIWDLSKKDNNTVIKATPFNLMQRDVFMVINFYKNKMLKFEPKYVETIQYLEIRFKDTDIRHEDCKKPLAWIKKQYGEPHKWTDQNEIILFEDHEDIISKSQIDLIKSKTDRTDILDLHKSKLESYSNIDDRNKWKLLKLRWSNLFCFGPKNSIDFTKLKSLTSIIGPNGTGKSSILDVLIFVLFNYQNRGSTRQNMILESANQYNIECDFSVGTKKYTIKRTGDRKKHVTYNLIDATNEVEKDITGADVNEMYQTVSSLIGTHKDFLNTNLRSQESGSFVEKSKTDQNKEIKSYLNLNILTQIHKDTKSKIISLRKKIKTLNNQVHHKDATQENIDRLTRRIQKTLDIQETLEVKIQDYTNELSDFHLYKTRESTNDIPKLQTELENMPPLVDSDPQVLQTQIQQLISNDPEIIKNIDIEIEKLRVQIPQTTETVESLKDQIISEESITVLQTESPEELSNNENIQQIRTKISEIPNFNPFQRQTDETQSNMEKFIQDNNVSQIDVYKMDPPTYPEEPEKPTRPKFLEGHNFKQLYKELQDQFEQIKKSKEIHIPSQIQKTLKWSDDCSQCKNNKNTLYVPASNDEKIVEKKLNALNIYKERALKYRQQSEKFKEDMITFTSQTEKYKQNQQNIENNKIYQKRKSYENDLEYLIYKKQLDSRNVLQTQLDKMDQNQNELSNQRLTNLSNAISKNKDLYNQIQQLDESKFAKTRLDHLESLVPKRKQYLKLLESIEQAEQFQAIRNRKAYLKEIIVQLKSNKEQEDRQIEIRTELQGAQSDLKSSNSKINELNTVQNKYEMDVKILDQIHDSEKQLELFSAYNKYVVDPKTGIQEALVEKQRTIIEKTTNSILQDLTSFTIKFTPDELMMCKNKKFTSASLSSGAQKFMIDIALRLTLTNLHPFNPPLLIIDEGFGRLDKDHAANIREFLTQIKNQTRIVFITHIDNLKNIADQAIVIKSTDGISSVVF